MAQHTAKSLFDLNIVGAKESIALYEGLDKIRVGADITWLLRASIVFSVSAMDAYFHDKVRYRMAQFNVANLPDALRNLQIKMGDLAVWESHKRKGNAIRNIVVERMAFKSLQGMNQIADAMRLCGEEGFWGKVYPDKTIREQVLIELKEYGDRRNDIVHEGDRLSARNSGKVLRDIDLTFAQDCCRFVENLVTAVEQAFAW
ncbi:MAG: hypothetical protein CVU59_00230 [Deltaproteobacteria bacterium HGW-Deltaproteobacteria-17]|nr:MAG: hypothetical protein CVU59_00230 [Deltaproteobacteria bacterium HGW-Deltaproteobacteria-17]